MPTLKDFLARGYLPKELPPCFTSEPFAKAIDGAGATLPAAFDPMNKHTASKPVRFNLSRPGMIRRPLAIPNPIAYCRLARLAVAHWTDMKAVWSKSRLSLSMPVEDSSLRRALDMKDGFPGRKTRRCTDRAGARFILKADVAEFYPSLYTHSIPWALHGKPIAKGNRKGLADSPTGLCGNDIDGQCQRANDGQTKGIPIGPDTSFAIGETLLSAVDAELQARLPDLRGFRIFDDYELMFDSHSDAEHGLATLQRVLTEFELTLNPRKTSILELPAQIGDNFTGPLASFAFALGPSVDAAVQRDRIIAYFDWLFGYARTNPEEPAIAYAVGRFKREPIIPANWDCLTGLLLQAASCEPSSFPNVAEILVSAHQKGLPIPLQSVGIVVNRVIERHCVAGHSSEVAWALWLALRLGLTIGTEAAAALSDAEDSVVAIMALDALTSGLIPAGLNTGLWETKLSQAHLHAESWLLAYEASIQGWLKPTPATDYVGADALFAWLRSNSVSFYRPVGTATTKPKTKSKPVAAKPKTPKGKPPAPPHLTFTLAPRSTRIAPLSSAPPDPSGWFWFYG